MTKSKILIDRLAKLIKEGLITSKDIGDEIKNSLNYKKESVINKLNLVTRDEFEIQKARLDKIQEEWGGMYKNTLEPMYRKYASKQYSFLYLKLRKNPPEMFQNFQKKINWKSAVKDEYDESEESEED